jgi:hypothetical protein
MRYVWVLVLVLAVVIFVGANLLWNALFGVSLSGSLSASGQEVGDWVLTPDICESGDRRSFFGARMYTSHDSRLASFMSRIRFRDVASRSISPELTPVIASAGKLARSSTAHCREGR